jgi:hypothetical protein
MNPGYAEYDLPSPAYNRFGYYLGYGLSQHFDNPSYLGIRAGIPSAATAAAGGLS